MHWIRRAASRADCTAGNKSEIKMPMIVMTTSNSTSEKPAMRVLGVCRTMTDCRTNRLSMLPPMAKPHRAMQSRKNKGKSIERGFLKKPISRTASLPRLGPRVFTLVGLLAPEFGPTQPSHRQKAVMANQNGSSYFLGYSGGAAPDLHRVPCLSAASTEATDHQRTR